MLLIERFSSTTSSLMMFLIWRTKFFLVAEDTAAAELGADDAEVGAFVVVVGFEAEEAPPLLDEGSFAA